MRQGRKSRTTRPGPSAGLPASVRRGISLGQMLMLVSLMITVAFAVAGASFSNLALTTRATNTLRARAAAESTLALTLERLANDMAWGTRRAREEQIEYRDSFGTASGRLVMHADEAAAALIPLSTNNLLGDTSVPSSTAFSVPPHAAHLVAVGECAGVRQAVEAEVNLPDFPFVLASSGQVLSERGGVFVSGVRSLEALSRGLAQVPADAWVPGHLASNSACRDARKAVLLGPGSRVTGDVRSQGEVKLDPTATVNGSVKRGSRPVGLPRIDVTEFDTVAHEGVEHLPARLQAAGPGQGVTLSGYSRAAAQPGALALEVSGDLLLRGAVLYVDGDMVVHGGVAGKGAIFVNGRTTIERGAQIEADDSMALVSRGDVVLRGASQEASAFRGLVYTEGNFSADHMSLLGTFVANGGGEGSLTQVNDVNLVTLPDASRVTVEVGPQGGGFVCAQKVAVNEHHSDDVPITYKGSVQDFYNPRTQRYEVTTQNLDPARVLANQVPVMQWWQQSGGLWNRGQNGTTTNQLGFMEAVRQVVAAQVASLTGGQGAGTRRFKVDLNQYVRLSDRMRILVWRELPLR